MLKYVITATLALTLGGCETIALLGSAGADDQPPPVQEQTPAAVVLPLPEPIRSSQPLTEFAIEQKAYAGEDQDHGTPPFTSLIPDAYEAVTPSILPGAKLVSTYEMHQLVLQQGNRAPVLINVLGGERSENIAGSIWLSGAGAFGRMDDTVQTRLANHLKTLTDDDKQRALVFYCLGVDCWLSFNAGLRAIALGYRNVHWYRGGLRSWYAAGLPTTPTDNDIW